MIPTIIVPIGKESNRLEDLQAGLIDDTDQPLNRYGPRDLIVLRELAIPILRHLGVRETARQTGLGVGTVSAALNGSSTPRPKALRRYLTTAEAHAETLITQPGLHAEPSTDAKLRQAQRLLASDRGDGHPG